MPAYVMAFIEVKDPVGFEEYRQKVPPTIAAHGGRYLARGGQAEAVEGTSPGKRVAILEFPSYAQAKAWWESPEYQPLRVLRERTTDSTLIITEGL